MKIVTGCAAPVFSLYNSQKQKQSLEDLAGKNVLLLFFPLAFTGVCTKELCSVRDTIHLYNDTDAAVWAISVDSPQTLARFKEDQQLNFTLLSDFNKEVSQLYGCLYDTFVLEMRGVSKRSAFVIDKKGTVRYAEVLENAGEVPNFEAIIAVLSAIN
jgi:peroxiredoxin